MFVKFLYAVVAVLVLILGWQSVSWYQVNRLLEKDMAAQSYGASEHTAKITIVAFMDYACRSCKDTNPFLMQAVAESPDTRVIFRPLADEDSPASVTAARYALAAAKQGKFIEAHEELMRNERPVTESVLDELTARLGLNKAQLTADAAGEDVTQALNNALDAFNRLGMAYTPSLLINGKIIFVVVRPDAAYGDILQLIAKERTS